MEPRHGFVPIEVIDATDRFDEVLPKLLRQDRILQKLSWQLFQLDLDKSGIHICADEIDLVFGLG